MRIHETCKISDVQYLYKRKKKRMDKKLRLSVVQTNTECNLKVTKEEKMKTSKFEKITQFLEKLSSSRKVCKFDRLERNLRNSITHGSLIEKEWVNADIRTDGQLESWQYGKDTKSGKKKRQGKRERFFKKSLVINYWSLVHQSLVITFYSQTGHSGHWWFSQRLVRGHLNILIRRLRDPLLYAEMTYFYSFKQKVTPMISKREKSSKKWETSKMINFTSIMVGIIDSTNV